MSSENVWLGHLVQYFTGTELLQALLSLLMHVKPLFLIGQRLPESLKSRLLLLSLFLAHVIPHMGSP